MTSLWQDNDVINIFYIKIEILGSSLVGKLSLNRFDCLLEKLYRNRPKVPFWPKWAFLKTKTKMKKNFPTWKLLDTLSRNLNLVYIEFHKNRGLSFLEVVDYVKKLEKKFAKTTSRKVRPWKISTKNFHGPGPITDNLSVISYWTKISG